MNTQDDGGPAFPMQVNDMTSSCSPQGMSLRDWFAGQALQSLQFDESLEQARDAGYSAEQAGEYIAKACYKIADAMLEARKQP